MRKRLGIAVALLFASVAILIFFCTHNEKLVQISAFDPWAPAPSYSVPQKTLSESELKSNEQVRELSAQANTILGKIKQVCDDFHLEFVGAKEFVPTQGTISSSGSYLKSPKADFRFWLPTQQLTSWNNDTLELSLITGANGSIHHLSPDQHWSQDKAFEIGTAFLNALLNGTDVKLSQGDAKFIPQQSRNGSGQWLLKWKRVDSHGYRFQNNEFRVQLPEGYCPVEAQIPEIVPYVEETGTLISQAKAFEIAHSEHLTSTVAEWSVVRNDAEVPVNEPGVPEIVKNRLVWFFWFEPPGDSFDTRPVFIDAYTGESQPVFVP
jgi:hypothetical protein